MSKKRRASVHPPATDVAAAKHSAAKSTERAIAMVAISSYFVVSR